MLTHRQESLLVLAGLASLLPVWRSGGLMGLTFWGFIYNHTIFAGGKPEYVPAEDYQAAICVRAIGRRE